MNRATKVNNVIAKTIIVTTKKNCNYEDDECSYKDDEYMIIKMVNEIKETMILIARTNYHCEDDECGYKDDECDYWILIAKIDYKDNEYDTEMMNEIKDPITPIECSAEPMHSAK